MTAWHMPIDNRVLTPRQKEVIELVCLGKSNAEIGAIIGCATHTAKNHVEACRRKLRAQNRTLLVAKYLAPERFK